MEILKVSTQDSKKNNEVVRLIKQGKVIVCPTDTLYGLIADATNRKAVKRLFEIKKRPRRKAIPIFVKDIKMAKKLAYINKNQENFLKTFWPGKVTVVLKSKKKPSKIGLRIPNYKLINILLEKLRRPLTGTSANISGKPASGNIKRVLNQFKNQKNQPDLVIDAGNLAKSRPSIVLDLTTSPPKIIRS